MLRADGHDPVARLCVRHDADRYMDLADLLRAAPLDLDIVMPATRERIAPLLAEFEPGVALCIGFPWKVPPDVLAVPLHGIVNGHPSLLPRYRGPSPVSRAIRNGETEIGFTFHYMDAALDTGNVLAQERIPLGGRATRSNGRFVPGASTPRRTRAELSSRSVARRFACSGSAVSRVTVTRSSARTARSGSWRASQPAGGPSADE
jgi:hypothetical protein